MTMLDLLPQQDHLAIGTRAWRVVFEEPSNGAGAGAERITIKEPQDVCATLTEVDAEMVLASKEPASRGTLEIIWAPPGDSNQPDLERVVEAWVRKGADALRHTPLLAEIRTVRVFWHDTRALIYSDAEHLHDALDAVARFTLVERETALMEQTMRSMWATIRADETLTHAVTWRDQKRQPHVNDMTVFATRMRVMSLRVANALEQLDATLNASSKRLYSELVAAAGLYDRLEYLEAPIQLASDHYELANTRLIEAKNAATDRRHALLGHVLEIAILLLLAFETSALLYQIRFSM
jgi:hypothetical protein